MLASTRIEILTLDAHPTIPEPDEDADSFEGNARKKALHYARLTDLWALADDSGLQVDALAGEPGVHSARYAGEACSDAANNAKLLEKLRGVPAERRTARFRCVLALANPAEVVATASGTLEGLIVDEPRGHNGFGYDPHFFVPELGQTVAEMPPEQKNRISHRGRALAAIRASIERELSGFRPSAAGTQPA